MAATPVMTVEPAEPTEAAPADSAMVVAGDTADAGANDASGSAADQAAKLIARSTAFARQGEAKVQYVNIAEQVSSVADVDADGRDEIVYGAMVVDDDGRFWILSDVLLAFDPAGADRPAYVMRVGWREGVIALIRDTRYERALSLQIDAEHDGYFADQHRLSSTDSRASARAIERFCYTHASLFSQSRVDP